MTKSIHLAVLAAGCVVCLGQWAPVMATNPISPPPATSRAARAKYTVDVSAAPEMKAWAYHTAEVCEKWYPRIARILASNGYTPPDHVYLTMIDEPNGVAATGGNHITASVQWFKAHPDDVGAIVHETVHVIQGYPRYDPVWLVEGIADYVRWHLYEPRPQPGNMDPDKVKYSDSYRRTAAFLAFVTRHDDKKIVPELNAALRADTYQTSLFQKYTGKTLDQLGSEWRDSLRPAWKKHLEQVKKAAEKRQQATARNGSA
jgi:hypothetical protein